MAGMQRAYERYRKGPQYSAGQKAIPPADEMPARLIANLGLCSGRGRARAMEEFRATIREMCRALGATETKSYFEILRLDYEAVFDLIDAEIMKLEGNDGGAEKKG